MQETWVQSLVQEYPLEEAVATHCSILPGESHGKRSLVGYSLWGHKESDMTEQHSIACTERLTALGRAVRESWVPGFLAMALGPQTQVALDRPVVALKN